MTTFDLDEYIIDALRAGASGFLVKDAPPEEVVHAVRVHRRAGRRSSPRRSPGGSWTCGRDPAPVPSAARDAALAAITARELTVLKLVARGLSNTDIALEMDLAAEQRQDPRRAPPGQAGIHRSRAARRLRLRARTGPARLGRTRTAAPRSASARRTRGQSASLPDGR